jgi:hypothetical protein
MLKYVIISVWNETEGRRQGMPGKSAKYEERTT